MKSDPTSPLVGPAYVSFADIYFDDALAAKVDWAIPREAYERVAKLEDASANRLWIYAQYKLGFVQWNLGARAEAIAAFKRAIEATPMFPDQPGSSMINVDAGKTLTEL